MGFAKAMRPETGYMQVSPAPRKVITSAQLLALFTTPITIVPAPGANKALIFVGAMIVKPAGTAYNLTTATGLSVKYTNAAGAEVGQVAITGFLDQATAQFRYMRSQTAAGGAASGITPVVNSPLVLHMLTANITTGNSPLYVYAEYITMPTT